ncbi:MAG: hypothetical protein NZ529_00160 [Cytophagaceae bacterium]|nr:hypothetical protein [Cytophagaceae bacterium]MDW8455177.1 hypothetical protein [Cytophagaceae bacterium]
MNLKNFDRTCARDGSHGLQGQCGALAEHRSDSGVADSPAPQGRAQDKKTFHHTFCQCLIWVELSLFFYDETLFRLFITLSSSS